MTDPTNTVSELTVGQAAARLLRERAVELESDWSERARQCAPSGGLDVLVRQPEAQEHLCRLFSLFLQNLEDPSTANWEQQLKTWTNMAESRGYPLSALVRACLLWKDTLAFFYDRLENSDAELLVQMAGAVGAAIDEQIFYITDLSYHVASQVVMGAEPAAVGQEQLTAYTDQFRRAAERRTEEIAALTRITTAITGPPDLDRVFQVVAFELAKFYPFDRLAIMLKQPTADSYSIQAFSVDGSSSHAQVSIAPLTGSALECVEARRQIVIEANLEEHVLIEQHRALLEQGLKSSACVPLFAKEQVIGALQLASRQPHAYLEANTSLLQEIAEELAVAVERARLYALERKRVGELEIINEIGKMAVATFDLPSLLNFTAREIREHFSYYDVSIFLVDRGHGEVVLAAQNGAYTTITPPGYRQKFGVGLVGWTAEHGETVVANDVTKDPRRIIAFPGEIVDGSEVCIPFFAEQQVAGIINVECDMVNSFDPTDIATLETVAGLLSKASENARLYQQTRELTEFRESIIGTIPSGVLVLDEALNVNEANPSFCDSRQTDPVQILGRPLSEFFPKDRLEETDVEHCVRRVLETGEPITLRNVRFSVPGRAPKIVNLYMTRIRSGEAARALLVEENVTENVEGFYRLSVLRQVNEAIQGTLDLDTLFHQVLTCVTAGPALGFNRAFLLLADKDENVLQGQMGVGPSSYEDALRIWHSINEQHRELSDMLAETSYLANKEKLPLYPLARRLRFSLDKFSELPVLTVHDKQAYVVSGAQNDRRVSRRLLELLGADEFVCAPLIANDEVVGVILADNLYSHQPITEQRVEMLAIFANHAGLALENAEAYANLSNQMRKLEQAYQRLEETQDRLVRSEKLAAIGEVAAHVAHEIRNPLVTIGGFARSILRTIGPEHRCTKAAQIIVDEVVRLEKILANVMDFTKPSTPWYSPTDINQVLDQTLTLLTHEIETRRVTVSKNYANDLAQVQVDAEQLKQAFLNILKNAAESIDQQGRIVITTHREHNEVRISIQDTGKGMTPEVQEKLFSPFFTTKEDGTGLGLALTQKIIENHGGRISVSSKLNVGTVFNIFVPVTHKK